MESMYNMDTPPSKTSISKLSKSPSNSLRIRKKSISMNKNKKYSINNFFIPLCGVLHTKGSLKNWSKKYFQLFSDQLAYCYMEDYNVNEEVMLAGQTILYTDINMIILFPLKKDGCRFDIHLHSNMVLSLLADTPQIAMECYAMQLPWNNIPRHFMFFPDSNRIVILFRSPIPQPKHELNHISKILFDPNAALSRESLPNLLFKNISSLFHNKVETDKVVSKTKIEFLKYKNVYIGDEPHSNFEKYLDPISDISVRRNPTSPKVDKRVITPPSDLAGISSFFRHLLDIIALISNDDKKFESFMPQNNDSTIFTCEDEKNWLENIGILNNFKQYYIKLIYTHDYEAEVVKHPHEVVFTYTEKRFFLRSSFFNFVCNPYIFKAFYARGRKRGSIITSSSNEELVSPEFDRKREASPINQEKLEIEFSVDGLMVFFKHITESTSMPIKKLLLAECKKRNNYLLTQIVVASPNEKDLLILIADLFLITYAYEDVSSIEDLAKITEDYLFNDDDEWPYIDCSLDTFFSALNKSKSKLNSHPDAPNILSKFQEIDEEDEDNYRSSEVEDEDDEEESEEIHVEPSEINESRPVTNDSQVPDLRRHSFQDGMHTIKKALDLSKRRSTTHARCRSTDIAIQKELFCPKLTKNSYAEFRRISYSYINNICLFENCKRKVLLGKRYCTRHSRYAQEFYSKRTLFTLHEKFQSICAIISSLRNDEVFMSKLLGFSLTLGQDIVGKIYPVIALGLLTRSKGHVCLNLGQSYKTKYSCLNIPIQNWMDPIANLSTKFEKNSVINNNNATYRGVGKRGSVSVSAADLKSNIRFRKHLSVPSLSDDSDFVWTSIGTFASNGYCNICSSASKKLIANLETNPPCDEDASLLCQTYLLMLLKPCWEWSQGTVQDIAILPSELFVKAVDTFGLQIKNAVILFPLLRLFSLCDVSVRLFYMKYLNELLITKAANVEVIVSNPDWASEIWPMFCDIPILERTEIEGSCVEYLMHYIGLNLFHVFTTHDKFLDKISYSICDLIRYGGMCVDSIYLSHDILISFLSKLKKSMPKYTLSFKPSLPLWKNFVDLCDFFTSYLLGTSKWGTVRIFLLIYLNKLDAKKASVAMILTHRHSVQITFPIISFDGANFSFDLSDAAISLGLHVHDSGDFMDIDLIERILGVFKVLGIDKFDQKSHVHCLEEEKLYYAAIYNYYNFYEDLMSAIASLKLKREFSGFTHASQTSAFLSEFLLASDRVARINILSQLHVSNNNPK